MTTPARPRPEDLLVHAGFVRGLARALLRGDRYVDDVVQETWLAAVEGGPQVPGAERAWLSRVVRNRVFGVLRREGRRARREQRVARSEGLPSTHEIAVREETRRELVDALLSLGEPSRTAVILRYYEDLPPREVARRLGVPVETARSRVKRGLAELRRRFDERHDGRRAAWTTVLLPLAELPGPAAGVGTVAAVAVWAKVVVALGLLAALVVGVRLLWDLPGAPPTGSAERPSGASEAPVLVGRTRADEDVVETRVGRGRIVGRVHRRDVPVVATVSLRWGRSTATPTLPGVPPTLPSMPADREACCDSDGRYVIDALAPGVYEVRATASDGVTVCGRLHLFVDGQHVLHDFDLPEAEPVLEGRVRWKDGRPWLGTVTAMRGPMWGRSWILARTDEAGRFRLPGLSAGSIRLQFSEWGRFVVGRSFDWAGPGTTSSRLEVVIDEDLSRVRGRVLDEDGNPIRGARVVSLTRSDGTRAGCSALASTDAGGAFVVDVLPVFGYVHVSADGYLDASLSSFAGGEIRLSRASRLRGSVRDENGRLPGAGIPVTVATLAESRTMSAPSKSKTVTTDGDGRYEVAVRPGRVFAYAHGGGWASPEVSALRRDASVAFTMSVEPGESAEMDLIVVPTGVLWGRVEDEEGRPVAGALVHVQAVRGARYPNVLGTLSAYGASDEEGRFRVDGVVPGIEMRATAARHGYVEKETEPFSLSPGASVEVTLRLPEPRHADVLVLDVATDQPVSHATVELALATTWDWDFVLSGEKGETDEHGRVRIDGLAPGGMGVRAGATGYVKDWDWRPVRESLRPGPFDVVVRIQPEMRLAGRVVLPEGVPPDDARICLEPVEGTIGVSFPSGKALGEGGNFRFDGRAIGSYEITAWVHHEGRRYSARTVVRESDEDITLVLEARRGPREMWVRVRDADGNWAVSSVALYVFYERGTRSTVQSTVQQAQGGLAVFEPSAHFEHAYVLVVPPCEGPRAGRGSALLGPLEPVGGELDVTLPAERRLEGVVRYDDGTPGAGLLLRVAVDLGAAGIQHPFGTVQEVRTDAKGRFHVRGLGRFPYEITFQPRPDGWTPPAFSVRAEDDTPLIVLEEPPSAVEIKVRDPRGHPAVDARVSVYPLSSAGGPEFVVRASTGGDGVARLVALDPALRYRLWIWGKNGTWAEYADLDWSTAESTVQLQEPSVISGEVRTSGGRLVRANVWRRNALGRWACVHEGARSRFRTAVVPVGRHEFTTTPTYARPSEDARGKWIASGDQSATLAFDAGPSLWIRIENWPQGEFGTAVLLREGGDDSKPQRVQISRDGVTEFHRLAPDGRYALFSRRVEREGDAVDASSCVYERGLRPVDEDIVLRLQPGHRITGRIDLGGGIDPGSASVHVVMDGHRAWGRVRVDGRFEVDGLPEGTWILDAKATRSGEVTNTRVSVRTGETVEICLP